MRSIQTHEAMRMPSLAANLLYRTSLRQVVLAIVLTCQISFDFQTATGQEEVDHIAATLNAARAEYAKSLKESQKSTYGID